MSWEPVDQALPKTKASGAPVSMSLIQRGAHVRLYCTLSPEVLRLLAWAEGEEIGLEVGRGANAGMVRLRPKKDGRRVRILPNSGFRSVELAVPEDLARWQAPRRAAEHDVQKGGVLVATLPWDFSTAETEAGEAAEAA